MKFLLNGISLAFTENEGEFCRIAKSKMKRAADVAQFHFCVYKRSVDARKKDDIRFVCSVLAISKTELSEKQIEKILACGFVKAPEDPSFEINGKENMKGRPLIVGCGPAGLFCALLLSEKGYRPIVIDRGGDVFSRQAAYKKFCEEHILDKENNIQFGAGGAGTFSDGKLTTRINDPYCSYVLEKLKALGAPDDVTLKAKPHIGTDILAVVVSNAVEKIRENGGEVIFNCRYEGHTKNPDGSLRAKTSHGDMDCACIVLAVGHSARDTYTLLKRDGFSLEAKPFSVGVRIEHLREDIDRALYGKHAGDPRLGAGEYNFSDTRQRGVYTFCMCPGGSVVAAATEDGGVVVNGMSSRGRDLANSNSAIAVTVLREDYGGTVEKAIAFQRKLERAAFAAGGGDYRAPIQTVGDFLNGNFGTEPTRVQPSYMGGNNCSLANLTDYMPEFVSDGLKRGITSFGKRLSGFDSQAALLTGFETRTSSPVRILRGETLTSLSDPLVYPCGEGAGYAGGITSAAVDGLRVANAILCRFLPAEK